MIEICCPNCDVIGKMIKLNSRDYKFNCAICGLAFDLEVTCKPLMTPREAQAIFQSIQLTKQQRTGSGNKPFKRK
jgi:hypothetical protein